MRYVFYVFLGVVFMCLVLIAYLCLTSPSTTEDNLPNWWAGVFHMGVGHSRDYAGPSQAKPSQAKPFLQAVPLPSQALMLAHKRGYMEMGFSYGTHSQLVNSVSWPSPAPYIAIYTHMYIYIHPRTLCGNSDSIAIHMCVYMHLGVGELADTHYWVTISMISHYDADEFDADAFGAHGFDADAFGADALDVHAYGAGKFDDAGSSAYELFNASEFSLGACRIFQPQGGEVSTILCDRRINHSLWH